MTDPQKLRRRSPAFVREWSSNDLHAVATRFNHERASGDLSDRQEWLWDGIVSELEYRRRRALVTGDDRCCSCELCMAPFGQQELPYASRPDGVPISPKPWGPGVTH